MAFQPTLPARGATSVPRQGAPICVHFNPRSPHGERPHKPGGGAATTRIFQPTLPARGATLICSTDNRTPLISTHAPRTGSDSPTRT